MLVALAIVVIVSASSVAMPICLHLHWTRAFQIRAVTTSSVETNKPSGTVRVASAFISFNLIPENGLSHR